MSTGIHKHQCTGVRLGHILTGINNCVTFSVLGGDDVRQELQISLFGLSDKKAQRLVEVISEIEKMEDE